MGAREALQYIKDQEALRLANTPPPPEPQSGLLRRTLGDTAVSALKGTIGVPEAAVGVADLVTGGTVGKTLEETVGFDPKGAKEVLDTLYSTQQQAANKKVQEAEGFTNKLQTALQNPSTIYHTVVESAPSMLAAGGVGRGVLKLAPRLSGAVAGAAGEGVVSAGQTAESVRQESPDGTITPRQALIAAGSGALTGGIGAVSGKVATKLGVGDVESMLARGSREVAETATPKNLLRRVAEGALTEGVFEEMPQSAQEQIAQNLAQGKQWDEGVGGATAMGLLAGVAMGGGANLASTRKAQIQDQIREELTNPPPATPTLAEQFLGGTSVDQLLTPEAIQVVDAEAATPADMQALLERRRAAEASFDAANPVIPQAPETQPIGVNPYQQFGGMQTQPAPAFTPSASDVQPAPVVEVPEVPETPQHWTQNTAPVTPEENQLLQETRDMVGPAAFGEVVSRLIQESSALGNGWDVNAVTREAIRIVREQEAQTPEPALDNSPLTEEETQRILNVPPTVWGPLSTEVGAEQRFAANDQNARLRETLRRAEQGAQTPEPTQPLPTSREANTQLDDYSFRLAESLTSELATLQQQGQNIEDIGVGEASYARRVGSFIRGLTQEQRNAPMVQRLSALTGIYNNINAERNAGLITALESGSAATVLDHISANSASEFSRELASRLRTALDGAMPEIRLRSDAGNAIGTYNRGTHTVTAFRNGSTEQAVLHELVHAATVKGIENNPHLKRRIKILAQHVIDTHNNADLSHYYGLDYMRNYDGSGITDTMAVEFIAEALSRREFQELLAVTPAYEAPTSVSVWTRLLETICNALGISTTNRNITALDQALSLGARAINVTRADFGLEGFDLETNLQQTPATPQAPVNIGGVQLNPDGSVGSPLEEAQTLAASASGIEAFVRSLYGSGYNASYLNSIANGPIGERLGFVRGWSATPDRERAIGFLEAMQNAGVQSLAAFYYANNPNTPAGVPAEGAIVSAPLTPAEQSAAETLKNSLRANLSASHTNTPDTARPMMKRLDNGARKIWKAISGSISEFRFGGSNKTNVRGIVQDINEHFARRGINKTVAFYIDGVRNPNTAQVTGSPTWKVTVDSGRGEVESINGYVGGGTGAMQTRNSAGDGALGYYVAQLMARNVEGFRMSSGGLTEINQSRRPENAASFLFRYGLRGNIHALNDVGIEVYNHSGTSFSSSSGHYNLTRNTATPYASLIVRTLRTTLENYPELTRYTYDFATGQIKNKADGTAVDPNLIVAHIRSGRTDYRSPVFDSFYNRTAPQVTGHGAWSNAVSTAVITRAVINQTIYETLLQSSPVAKLNEFARQAQANANGPVNEVLYSEGERLDKELKPLTPKETEFFNTVFDSEADLQELMEEVPSAMFEDGVFRIDPAEVDAFATYVDDVVRLEENKRTLPPSFLNGTFAMRFVPKEISPKIATKEGVNPEAQKAADKLSKGLAPLIQSLSGIVPVQVVASPTEVPNLPAGAPEFNAVYHEGTIYVNAQRVTSVSEAERVILDHEVRHHGLRQILGARFKTLMQQVWFNKNYSVKEYARQWGIDVTTQAGRLEAAEEFVVSLAQDAKTHPALDRTIAMLRNAMRSLGFKLKFSTSELRALVAKAGVLRAGGVNGGDTRMSRGLKTTPGKEAWLEWGERDEEVRNQIVSEYLSNTHEHMPWKLVPASRLKKVWKDFSATGVVHDTKGLDSILDRCIENALRLQFNNEISGHESFYPDNELESIFGEDYSEEQKEALTDWAVDLPSGGWRISDYGLPKITNYLALALEATTPELRLTYLDMALNVVHQRSDLASWFVEGGSKTLSAVSGQGDTGLDTARFMRSPSERITMNREQMKTLGSKLLDVTKQGVTKLHHWLSPQDRLIDFSVSQPKFAPIAPMLKLMRTLNSELQSLQDRITAAGVTLHTKVMNLLTTKEEEQRFNRVMANGTLWGIFAYKEVNEQPWNEKSWETAGMLTRTGMTLAEAHAELRADWDAMTEAQQTKYKEVIANMEQTRNRYRDEMIRLVTQTTPEGAEREAMIASITAKFASIKGPYAPLTRFGDYIVQVYETTPNTEGVDEEQRTARYHFESKAEALQFQAQFAGSANLRATFDVNTRINNTRAELPSELMVKFTQAMEQAGIAGEQLADLQTDLNRIWMSLAPETSALKYNMRRTGLKGYNEDMMRSFMAYTQRHARAIAFLARGGAIRENMMNMDAAISAEVDKPGVSGETISDMRELVRSLKLHDQQVRTEKISKWVSSLSKVPFLWYLARPSVYLVQTAQPFVLAAPRIARKFGMGAALKAVSDHYARQLSKGTDGKPLYNNDRMDAMADKANQIEDLMAEQRQVAKDSAPYREYAARIQGIIDSVGAEDRLMLGMKLAANRQAINITLVHEAQSILNNDINDPLSRNSKWLMDKAGFFMQTSELASRKATFAAAYSLEMERSGDFLKATQYGIDVSLDTLYDYGTANRPEALTGNMGRLLGQFQIFRLHTIFKLAQLGHDAFFKRNEVFMDQAKEEFGVASYQLTDGKVTAVRAQEGVTLSPEQEAEFRARIEALDAEKGEARKELGFFLASTMAISGTAGLPLAGTVFAALSFLGYLGGDDDPMDAEMEFNRWLRSIPGGEVANKGLPALLGWDLSRRVGMSGMFDLFQGDPPENLKGAQKAAWYAAKLTGPVGGVATDMFKAQQAFSEGDWGKAVTLSSPQIVRDLAKGYHLASGEGFKTAGGKTLVPADQISVYETVLAFAGINPLELSLAQEKNMDAAKISTRIADRKRELSTAFTKAVADDAAGAKDRSISEIRAFNESMPLFAFRGSELAGAVRTAYKKEKGIAGRHDALVERFMEGGG